MLIDSDPFRSPLDLEVGMTNNGGLSPIANKTKGVGN